MMRSVAFLGFLFHAAAESGKFLQKAHEHDNHEHEVSISELTPEAMQTYWPPLVIALKQQNVDKLFEAALNVSTPGHKDYGQYWNASEIEQLTAPAAENVRIVTNWLTSINASFSVDYDLVSVISEVDVAERNMPSEVRAVTGAVYSLNSDPTSNLDHRAQPLPRKRVDPRIISTSSITPALIFEMFSMDVATEERSGLNSQMLLSLAGFTAPKKSLHTFLTNVSQSPLHQEGDADFFNFTTGGGSRAPPRELKCESEDPSPLCTGYGEPTLDVEYLVGIAPRVRTGLFRLDVPVTENWTDLQTPRCPTLLAFVNYLLKDSQAPYSATISYGSQHFCPDAQVVDLETRFAKLALKGVSLMAASGDYGTFSGAGDGCTTSSCRLLTTWPAASPWITAVGGTKLVNGTTGFGQEVWSGSGGGFSEHPGGCSRKIAPWQERAVSEYLTKLPSLPGAPPDSTFNAAAVGIPDVAAFATDMATCVWGQCTSAGEGTSYASPTFAGIVSLLNEARLQAKLPPMGFLNPFLYQHADAFTDITDGINRYSNDLYGFPATKGWDAATGLGTPNFAKLQAAALASFS